MFYPPSTLLAQLIHRQIPASYFFLLYKETEIKRGSGVMVEKKTEEEKKTIGSVCFRYTSKNTNMSLYSLSLIGSKKPFS